MDETDKKILRILKEDSRTPYVDIAKKIDLSEGTVRRRIENLKEKGVIKRFTVETTAAVEGVVLIKGDPKETTSVSKEIKKYAERVLELSGEYDIFCLLQAQDIKELNKKVDHIRETEGVQNTTTLLKLKETY